MRRLITILAAISLLTAFGCKPEDSRHESPMTKNPAAAAAGGASTATASVGGAGGHAFSGDAAKGEKTYKGTCIACHGADGKGNGGVTGPNFSTDKRFGQPEDTLMKSIADGKQGKVGMMPPQKGMLSEEEMKNVLAYMARSFGG